MGKPWEFSYVDFVNDLSLSSAERASDIATAKLKEWMNAAPTLEYIDDVQCGAQYWVVEGIKGPPADCKTHTGRLICVEPIKIETAEDLLKELCKVGPDGYVPDAVIEIIKRSRKLLGVK